MKKFGGVTLVSLGSFLIVIAVVRLILVLLSFPGGQQLVSAIGFVIGTALMSTLLIVIGGKSIKKGRSLLRNMVKPL